MQELTIDRFNQVNWKNVEKLVKQAVQPVNVLQGAKKIIFTACHLGKL